MYPAGTILKVKEAFYTHIGVSIGNGRVLHNHWKTGEKVVTVDVFSGGKDILVEYSYIENSYLFHNRVQKILANPKPYNLFTNNCEHTISKVMNGEAKSPQLASYGAIALCVGGVFLLSRAKN